MYTFLLEGQTHKMLAVQQTMERRSITFQYNFKNATCFYISNKIATRELAYVKKKVNYRENQFINKAIQSFEYERSLREL